MLRDVFTAYVKNPKLLGSATAKRLEQDGVERTVCDYVSGMTDRYLLDEHARLCAGKPRAVGPLAEPRGHGLRVKRSAADTSASRGK